MTAPDPRLDEIAARLEAATPGPWEYDGRDVNQSYDLAVRTGDYTLERVGIIPGDYVRSNDAGFIANAPADIAYLLAELQARDEALGRVAGVADAMETSMSGSHEFIGRTGLRFNAVERIRAAVAAATGVGE